ncbi:hypothetical protein CHX26_14285 [Porphyrobacter sp. HT-58-2]|uniref:hypothetical protein n=1 Tax=Porphyrobacter sp. HT-58-2 TaxID=2023229 RepID=UPI000CDC0363|nr:hypothetical protein [Porphyrobacter sp. HT-58-2]AUX70512.1 hypothetical protein CHX26_14285 [Porphyrobacter sp. HT-58-2]
MRSLAITLAIALAGVSAVPAAAQDAAAQDNTPQGTTIIVRPPLTEDERKQELREFTKQIVRPPRMRHPVAKFFYPICPQVLGLAPEEAEAIVERIRENARALSVGANTDPACLPTVKVAFMAPAAGPSDRWLTADSAQLAHLAIYERERVLAETGPVRAWNRVLMRDFNGEPIEVGRMIFIEPYNRNDPIVTTEITGAAVLIAREAAEGFTLAQLADYITMRALIGTGAPLSEEGVPARTILTLFDEPDPPAEMTLFDRSLVAEIYNASRNSSPRRVYNDIARAAAESERITGAEPEAPKR